MASITIKTEEESPRGWVYLVEVARGPGSPVSEHTVRLAWVDHEHWCGGRAAPSKVVEALVAYLVGREADRPLPESFDAATARRWHPGLDRDLPGLV